MIVAPSYKEHQPCSSQRRSDETRQQRHPFAPETEDSSVVYVKHHSERLVGWFGFGIASGVRSGSGERTQCILVEEEIVGLIERSAFVYVPTTL